MDFPYASISEATIFRVATAPGLFAYRQDSAMSLLHLPNLVGGNLTREQAEEALEQFVQFKRPLTALALFWSVVAIEDLIRQMSLGLARLPGLVKFFPSVPTLAAKPKPGLSRYHRPDGDPVALLDPTRVNARYAEVLGVGPIDSAAEPRLGDLIIIRHTVAHHGGLVRAIDLGRFTYYRMKPNALINPPATFVRETADFLYSVGARFMAEVRRGVFAAVAPALLQDWAGTSETVPTLVRDLVELFDYFGKLPQEQDVRPAGGAPEQLLQRLATLGDGTREALLMTCVYEVRNEYCTHG